MTAMGTDEGNDGIDDNDIHEFNNDFNNDDADDDYNADVMIHVMVVIASLTVSDTAAMAMTTTRRNTEITIKRMSIAIMTIMMAIVVIMTLWG